MSEPRISILTTVLRPPGPEFEDTVGSVLRQTYADWEWIIACPDVTAASDLQGTAPSDIRVKVVTADGADAAAVANAALAVAGGEFVALLDPGDTLAPIALAAVVEAIAAAVASGDGADFCYSDEDTIVDPDRFEDPYLKPDWSPERLRHHFFTDHLAVLRRELVESVGGFRADMASALAYDLVLRVTEQAAGIVHVPKVIHHVRARDDAAATGPAGTQAREAGVRAVQAQLDRLGIEATASIGDLPFLQRIDRVPDLTTPVSVIIPTIGTRRLVWGQTRTLVTEAVRSVLNHTRHEAVELVIVYDTPTPASVLDELRALGSEFDTRIRLIEFREPFNFSAKCNVGAFHAAGDVLIFLNDDVEVASAGVIEHLIAPLREPDVGMTGAKLLFETGLIQHAGVIFGAGTIHHSYFGHDADEPGVRGELLINRECSGLTGACVAMRRTVFEAAGGFTEKLPHNYNDVDLCNKVRAQGLRLVWLHDVVLHHFESASRKAVLKGFERRAIKARWGNVEVLPERYSNAVRKSPRTSRPATSKSSGKTG